MGRVWTSAGAAREKSSLSKHRSATSELQSLLADSPICVKKGVVESPIRP